MNHMPFLWGAGDPTPCLVHARQAFYQPGNISAFGKFCGVKINNIGEKKHEFSKSIV